MWIYLPLLDHRAHLITSQVHAVEVGQAVLALHVLSNELELAESNLIVLQVSKAHLEHATLQPIRGNSCRQKKKMSDHNRTSCYQTRQWNIRRSH